MSTLPFFRVALIIFLALILTSCGASTPREEFREQLKEKVKTLLTKINYLGSGKKEEVDVTMSFDGKSRESTMMVLKSSGIKGTAISISKMFEKVSIALLSQDIEGFDEWGENLKKDVSSYRQKISEATDRLAKRTQEKFSTVNQSFIDSFIEKRVKSNLVIKENYIYLWALHNPAQNFFQEKH